MNIEELKASIEKLEEAINAKQHEIDTFDPSDYVDEDEYETELNDLFGTVEICGMEKDSGSVLREIDYTAFREGFNNWLCEYDYSNIREYRDLEEELADLEEELADLENQLEEMEEE